MNRNRSVLIVEDDKDLAWKLADCLKQWGYRSFVPADFHEIDRLVRELDCLLVLMDITLPGSNGYLWTEKIRQFSAVPILFISGQGEKTSQIVALSSGADDYIVKPFHMEVLHAKIEALLRRSYAWTKSRKICLRDDLYFVDEKGCLEKGAEQYDLTGLERKILSAFCLNRSEVLTREKLKMELWQTDSYITDGSLTTCISRLRKKLESIVGDPLIETVKGKGYRLP